MPTVSHYNFTWPSLTDKKKVFHFREFCVRWVELRTQKKMGGDTLEQKNESTYSLSTQNMVVFQGHSLRYPSVVMAVSGSLSHLWLRSQLFPSLPGGKMHFVLYCTNDALSGRHFLLLSSQRILRFVDLPAYLLNIWVVVLLTEKENDRLFVHLDTYGRVVLSR